METLLNSADVFEEVFGKGCDTEKATDMLLYHYQQEYSICALCGQWPCECKSDDELTPEAIGQSITQS